VGSKSSKEIVYCEEEAAVTDLEDLVYSLIMLIIEGRQFEGTNSHANFMIESLMMRALELNRMAQGGCENRQVSVGQRAKENHICFNQLNSQCRIASNLKEQIEKCIQDHSCTTKNPGLFGTYDTDSDIAQKLIGLKTTRSNNSHVTRTQISVDVYLLADCCFTEHWNKSGANLLDNQDCEHFELLERWTISMVTNQKNENFSKAKLLTLNELFQAIRSYLHFSQISSWINQSKGSQPKNIAYSVSYLSDKDLPIEPLNTLANESTTKTFDFQTFPTLNLLLANNKFCVYQPTQSHLISRQSTQLQVNLLSRKRAANNRQPRITCFKHLDPKPSTSNNMTLNNSNSQGFSGVTQPIFIGSSTKSGAGKDPEGVHNIKNLLLPHWSSVMASPNVEQDTKEKISRNNEDINLNMTPDSTPLQTPTLLTPSQTNFKFSPAALTLFQSQSPHSKLNISTNSVSNNPITTPTSFPNSKMAFSICPAADSNSFPASQSPKVLVSNHQMLSDLCSFTQNRLRINNATGVTEEANPDMSSDNEQNLTNINKRKFLHDTDSATQPRIDHKPIEHLEAAIKVITTRITINTDTNESQHLNNNTDNSSLLKLDETENVDLNNNSNEFNLLKPRKLTKFSNIQFTASNLPLSSSPAPLRKSGSNLFDFDNSLKDPRSIRNALVSNNKLLSKAPEDNNDQDNNNVQTKSDTPQQVKLKRSKFANYTDSFKSFNMQMGFSNSAVCSMPITPSCLLGSFEESLLNGRMKPAGVVDGFYAEIGASGSFFPEHVTIPVHAAFYQVCEDIAASPYLGVINLGSISKRGYKVPNRGTIQVTLFNPNNTVVKMFVVMYDLSDMPPGHRTFLRQRTMYVPLASNASNAGNSSLNASKPVRITNELKLKNAGIEEDEDSIELKSYLRYLIHLRFATSKSGKMYLHTNVKLIFARNKCEIDPRLAKYEYKTFTEAPKNPRYSPKK